MRNWPLLINAAVMLTLLVGGGGMSAYVMATNEVRTAALKPYPGYDYLNGRLTAAVESSYKSELPIRQNSVNLLNAVTLALFDEGRKGVVVGAEGWLFSAEEYDWTPRSSTNLATNLSTIVSTARQLASRGIALEIALVPEKADVYAELLLRPRPSSHLGKYEQIRFTLAAQTGASIPDLRAVLLSGSTSEEVYFPTDTHWSVAGAGLAAKALADGFPVRSGAADAQFALAAQPTVHHEGDLLNFLQLGPFRSLLPATDDTVTPLAAQASGAEVGDLLGDAPQAAPQVVLVGTSYSANALWSFEPQLKAALGRDVLNLAQSGHGPFVPMQDFLKKLDGGQVAPKTVIWEIPVRYLDDDPRHADKNSA